MKIYISGTTGYLGSHLFKLSKDIYETIAINRKYSDDSMTYEEFKINKSSGYKILIHCAGLAHSKSLSDKDFYDANVILSKKLGILAIENKFSKFVYISSIGVHGNSNENISIKSSFSPYDAYSRSKIEAENELKKIFKNSKCKLIIVRPPLVVGKYAPGNIAKIEKLLHFLPITPFRLVKNKRSIIKIESLCKILLNIDSLSENILMPAEKEPLSTSQIFDLVASYHGKKFYHIPIPPIALNFFFHFLKKANLKENILGNLVIR